MNSAEKHSRLPLPFTGRALLFLAFAFPFFSAPASANTSVFTNTATCTISGNYCQALSLFGVLTSTSSDTLSIKGNWSFAGTIGVGTTDKLSKSGANTGSIIDFADAVTVNSNCASGNFCGSGTLSGTVTGNVADVTTAESQADTIRTALAGSAFNTGNGTVTSLAAGTASYNVEQGLTPGSIKVYRNTAGWAPTTAVTFGCGGSMCNANDLVVVKIDGGNLTLANSITLADGLSPDQVVFYLPSNNISINPTITGVSISGDFFTASSAGTYAFGGGGKSFTFYGRIFSDDGAITFNNKGGSQDDPGMVADPNSPVPEPGTWAMMAGGLATAIWLRRRKKRTETAV